MGLVDEKRDEPRKRDSLSSAIFTALSKPIVALVFAALLLGVGAGVYEFLGLGRHFPKKPGDFVNAAETTIGVFVMCLVMGGVSMAIQSMRRRGKKP